jgi:hypothetical protein
VLPRSRPAVHGQHLLIEGRDATEPEPAITADDLDRLVQPDIDGPAQKQQRSLEAC